MILKTAIEKSRGRCYSEVAMPRVLHPYVTNDPKICGGGPIISGTRFPVRSVVVYVLRHGLTPEELVAEFKHLTLAQVYDALSYYYDNRDELDREILENTEEYARRHF